jgi:WD40 repeat protein
MRRFHFYLLISLQLLCLSCKTRNYDSTSFSDRNYLKTAINHGFIEKIGTPADVAFVVESRSIHSRDVLVQGNSKGLISVIRVGSSEAKTQTFSTQKEIRSIDATSRGNQIYILIGSADGGVSLLKFDLQTEAFFPQLTEIPLAPTPNLSLVRTSQDAQIIAVTNNSGTTSVSSWESGTEFTQLITEFQLVSPYAPKSGIGAIEFLEDNSIVVSRDTGIEHWDPTSQTAKPILGFDARDKQGIRANRITSLGILSLGVDICPQPAAVIAAGDDQGKIMFFELPMQNFRYIPTAADKKRIEIRKKLERSQKTGSSGLSNAAKQDISIDRADYVPLTRKTCRAGTRSERRKSVTNLQQFLDEQTLPGIPWAINPETISAHRGRITGIAFNESATVFYSSSQDGTLAIWDLKKRQLIRKVALGRAAAGIGQISSSRDGGRVFFVPKGGSTTLVLHFDRLNSPLLVSKSPVSAIDFDNDRLLIADRKGTLNVYTTAKLNWTTAPKLIAQGTSEAPMVDLATPSAKPDGKTYGVDCRGDLRVFRLGGNRIAEEHHISSQEIAMQLPDANLDSLNSCDMSGASHQIALTTSADHLSVDLVQVRGGYIHLLWNIKSNVVVSGGKIDTEGNYMDSSDFPTVYPLQVNINKNRTTTRFYNFGWHKNSKTSYSLPLKLANNRISIGGASVRPTKEFYDVAGILNSDFVASVGSENKIIIIKVSGQKRSFEIPYGPATVTASIVDYADNGFVAVGGQQGVAIYWGLESYTYRQ